MNLDVELETKLQGLAQLAGQPADELAREAIAGYVDELADLRLTIETRYHDLANGSVAAIPGDEAKRLFDERVHALRASRG